MVGGSLGSWAPVPLLEQLDEVVRTQQVIHGAVRGKGELLGQGRLVPVLEQLEGVVRAWPQELVHGAV